MPTAQQLQDNPNDYTIVQLQAFESQQPGILTRAFGQDVSTAITNYAAPQQLPTAPLDKARGMTRDCTEVYFWGINSTGKTCALGTLLYNAVQQTSYRPEPEGNGQAYRDAIVRCFSQPIVTLPPGNPTNSINEIVFTLKGNHNKEYPLALLDMAGEVLLGIYESTTPGGTTTATRKQALDYINRFIKTNGNPKIHFFVIEYNSVNRSYPVTINGQIHQMGAPQLMDNCIQYLVKNNVLHNSDAAFVLVTKCDHSIPNRDQAARSYILNTPQLANTYSNILTDYCKNHELGGYGIIPFSIGQVYGQSMCKINTKDAANVFDIIRQCAPYTSFLQRYFKFLFD